MILSTQTEVGSERFGDVKNIRMICEAGFDAIDYSMFCLRDDDTVLNTPDYRRYVLELKKIAEGYGKFFNQAHAPFPSYRVGDDTYNKAILERIKRSIEIAGILGVKNIVVHPTYFVNDSQRNLELNAEFYNALIPLCKEYNIKVACENMFGWDSRRNYIVPNICSLGDEFRKMMEMLDPEYFTACVDIGHAGLVGTTASELLRALGHDYVGCLHVHDNNYMEDLHMPPFTCKLDWKAIAQALHDINYTGDVTLEDDGFIAKLPKRALINGTRLAADLASELRDMIAL